MANSKVVYYGNVLIDLTSDTVTPDKLFKGTTAHKNDGTNITGTAEVTVSNGILKLPSGLLSVS